MAIDLFQCEKLVLPNTKVKLKLICARPNFYMVSYNPPVSFKALDCSPFTRRVFVNEVYHQTIRYQLTHQPSYYNFMETFGRTFFIPSGHNQFIQENVSNNAPIRIIAIAMNTNSAFTLHFQEYLFHYQKNGLRELRIIQGGIAIISVDTIDCRTYVTTMKAMNFNEEIPLLPNNLFQNCYLLVFDLTSLQDAGENIYYPKLSGESFLVETFFNHPLRSLK